jgi:hypothetical protein
VCANKSALSSVPRTITLVATTLSTQRLTRFEFTIRNEAKNKAKNKARKKKEENIIICFKFVFAHTLIMIIFDGFSLFRFTFGKRDVIRYLNWIHTFDTRTHLTNLIYHALCVGKFLVCPIFFFFCEFFCHFLVVHAMKYLSQRLEPLPMSSQLTILELMRPCPVVLEAGVGIASNPPSQT